LLERLFGEERRRLKVVPNGFGEKLVLGADAGDVVAAASAARLALDRQRWDEEV
jgi:hypothetical protein